MEYIDRIFYRKINPSDFKKLYDIDRPVGGGGQTYLEAAGISNDDIVDFLGYAEITDSPLKDELRSIYTFNAYVLGDISKSAFIEFAPRGGRNNYRISRQNMKYKHPAWSLENGFPEPSKNFNGEYTSDGNFEGIIDDLLIIIVRTTHRKYYAGYINSPNMPEDWPSDIGLQRLFEGERRGVLNISNANVKFVDSLENPFGECVPKEDEEGLNDENEEEFESVLKHNLWGIHIKEKNDALSEENPHVCIGWSALGDLSGLETTEDIMSVYEQHFNKNNRAKGQDVGMIRRFLKELQIGDYIIFAESTEFHIGRIESDYYYDNSENPNQSPDYTNNRKVTWLKKHISRKDISKAMHGSLGTAMSIFGINDYRAAVVDLLRGDYKKDDDIICSDEDSIKLIFDTDVDIPFARNRILFGAPGTGKSFKLKSDCEKIESDFEGEYERVTFHPDYTYAQFVGTYKPIMAEDGEKIKYQYVPGPFMRVLVAALNSALSPKAKPYLLIIEEINRAKVAAVFGEVFQLLDRDDNGKSEYEIQASEDIRRYLADEIGGKPEDYAKLRIPNNMFIWATMNSADQGVFPMDTAFKRRWNFEYLGINEKQDIVKGRISVGSSSIQEIEWNVLRRAINEKLSKEYKVNEDKLMGPFFISKHVLKTISETDDTIKDATHFINVFKSKVIMYLYEDAAKQHKHKLFSGCGDTTKYSAVCDSFDKIGIQIFGEDFEEVYYNPQKG